MSTYHRLSIAAVVVLLLVAGCGKVEPTATPVSAAATRIAPGATNTSLSPTATPSPPTPTHTPVPPTETATPSPTATPMPIPTATPTPTSAIALPALTDASALDQISIDTADQVELLSTLSGHNDKVIDLAFSRDGTYIASSSLDRTIRLWDVTSRQEVDAFSMNKVGFNGIAFSADGRLLASADAIWDVESRQVFHTLEQSR